MNNLFVTSALTDPWFYFSWVIIVMFSICVHEYAHAAAALRCGDDTAAQEGHLTLNPLIQMGPTSMLILCVIGIAWGAVPVTPGAARKRWHEAWIAFAGPLANLVLCIVFSACRAAMLLVSAAGYDVAMSLMFFELAAAANGVLFFFNMLPIPLLDGWIILSTFVDRLRSIDMAQLQSISMIAILLILVTPAAAFVWGGGYLIGDLFFVTWHHAFALFG